MIINDEKDSKIELEGNFKINKKTCFCCDKMVNLYFVLTKDNFIFYSDKKKTKIYKIITRNLVLAINRRLRREKDANKLSIFYLENPKSYMIKELKLKSDNRYEMEKWISILNKKIRPKRFEFPIILKNYEKSNNIFQFKNETNFYVALCNLEYILLRNKMNNFFEYYKNKYKIIQEDDITVDNIDDIILLNES